MPEGGRPWRKLGLWDEPGSRVPTPASPVRLPVRSPSRACSALPRERPRGEAAPKSPSGTWPARVCGSPPS
eukprot:12324695-Alexandrium_andersonii.AAC.1